MAHSKSPKISKNQHLMCGRRLQDVAASLQQGVEQSSELPMIGIVRYEMELYSCNNRRLWCFKEATVEAVEVCMSSVDTTDRSSDGDFLPTTAVQGVCPRVRQPKKGLRRHILCSHKCLRERAPTAAASGEINNCHFCHRESRVQNGMRVQPWLWQLRPRLHVQANLHVTEELQQRVPHMMLVFIRARGRRN